MNLPKKSLGQNFLVDLNIIKKITNLSDIFNQNILEIGPGKGALTEEILRKKPKSLILIEKDYFLSNQLETKYKNNKIVKVFNQDILKFNLEEQLNPNTIVFGNLPYNISSQILVKMIKFKNWPPNFTALIFMFQKEMSERIASRYNTKKYGRLAILTDYRLDVISKFDVSPNCFYPKPKVLSSVILLKPKHKLYGNIKNIENLEKVTNVLFSNKRKMINKSIKKLLKEEKKINQIKDMNLKLRPSSLKPEKYFEITEVYERV